LVDFELSPFWFTIVAYFNSDIVNILNPLIFGWVKYVWTCPFWRVILVLRHPLIIQCWSILQLRIGKR
jgi:uncharacterized protein (DUF983 family)